MTDFDSIAAQRPATIEEAIPCMQVALRYFHERNDYRAVFLRAYYIITLNVHAAVHRRGDYTNPIFFDADWVRSQAGYFASLYFQSLTTFDREPESERAWKVAHRMAEDKSSTVLQDLLLGLNAHINYDLAYGTFLNLRQHGDDAGHLLLPRRKFDHDQVNNILVRSIPQIAETLTRDYGGGITLLRKTLRGLDIVLSSTGLKHYRERVWWSAVSYLTTTDEEEIGLVHQKLNWESAQLAKLIADQSAWSLPIRTIGRAIRKDDYSRITLESPAA
ncbi:DUF5995 family protein [Saccharothrix variisporea]|uniref:Uncharacterized protein n=1 Tax=Saccharothrix variisporea TaxID=543527 RepID=A0A495XNJ8_9PSEU|nr:DUF5995 family protein [Saccharothrix variisporea]RKT74484.1 hypothetical protein DFJ66_7844 [Saccharothrix variisporea]